MTRPDRCFAKGKPTPLERRRRLDSFRFYSDGGGGGGVYFSIFFFPFVIVISSVNATVSNARQSGCSTLGAQQQRNAGLWMRRRRRTGIKGGRGRSMRTATALIAFDRRDTHNPLLFLCGRGIYLLLLLLGRLLVNSGRIQQRHLNGFGRLLSSLVRLCSNQQQPHRV